MKTSDAEYNASLKRAGLLDQREDTLEALAALLTAALKRAEGGPRLFVRVRIPIWLCNRVRSEIAGIVHEIHNRNLPLPLCRLPGCGATSRIYGIGATEEQDAQCPAHANGHPHDCGCDECF